MPELLLVRALVPTAVLLLPVLWLSANAPHAVLLLPVLVKRRAASPNPVLLLPLPAVFKALMSAPVPPAVFASLSLAVGFTPCAQHGAMVNKIINPGTATGKAAIRFIGILRPGARHNRNAQ